LFKTSRTKAEINNRDSSRANQIGTGPGQVYDKLWLSRQSCEIVSKRSKRKNSDTCISGQWISRSFFRSFEKAICIVVVGTVRDDSLKSTSGQTGGGVFTTEPIVLTGKTAPAARHQPVSSATVATGIRKDRMVFGLAKPINRVLQPKQFQQRIRKIFPTRIRGIWALAKFGRRANSSALISTGSLRRTWYCWEKPCECHFSLGLVHRTTGERI